MTLYFYFARKFFWIFMGLLTVFFALQALVDMVDQLRKFDVEAIGFGQILQLTFLHTPKGIYQILPLIMILSTVALFLGLARSSELVVVRASGRSALATLMAPVMVAMLIGVVAISTINPIVAATTKRYEDLSSSMSKEGSSTLSISREGLWLRQGDVFGQTVIHASSANSDATILYGVTFVAYAPDGGPVRRIEAEVATLETPNWVLENAKVWPLIAGINAEANAVEHASLSVRSTLTRQRIRDGFGTPSTVSIWDLPKIIRQLEEAGFSARRHNVWLQMELAKPLFLTAMVLVAAAFTMRHTRFGRTGLAVLASILLGFSLYYIRNFAQILGENGQIPIALAAWAPPVASVMLALGLLLHMEDG